MSVSLKSWDRVRPQLLMPKPPASSSSLLPDEWWWPVAIQRPEEVECDQNTGIVKAYHKSGGRAQIWGSENLDCRRIMYRIPPGEVEKEENGHKPGKHQAPGRPGLLLMSSQEELTRRMTYDTSENHRVRRKAGVCQFERHQRPSGAVANTQALCTCAGQRSPSAEPWHHGIMDAMSLWNARTSSSTRRLIGTCATVGHRRGTRQPTR